MSDDTKRIGKLYQRSQTGSWYCKIDSKQPKMGATESAARKERNKLIAKNGPTATTNGQRKATQASQCRRPQTNVQRARKSNALRPESVTEKPKTECLKMCILDFKKQPTPDRLYPNPSTQNTK